MRQLILASTSDSRRQLLERLGLKFDITDPGVDETARGGETPQQLACRLAESKARAVTNAYPHALIIGSDQVAIADGEIVGKPGNREGALKQLKRLSGRSVIFHTAVCLLDSTSGRAQLDVVLYSAVLRKLDESQITNYLLREPAYQCAGSFKSEGLGIALFERLSGEDPTALVGLPLISLTRMLEKEGVQVI